MPKKIREIKAVLLKAGFTKRPGKGSHSIWIHKKMPDLPITIAGKDGDDAKIYLEKQVKQRLKKIRGIAMTSHYSMVIFWSEEDNCYLVHLPDFSFQKFHTHGDTYEEAARRGQEVIDSYLELYQVENKPLPMPKPSSQLLQVA